LPTIRSAARSVVGRYTPEQLYSSKRDAIQQEIFDETQKIVKDEYIQLNEILVRDVTLPPTIKDAIERKTKTGTRIIRIRIPFGNGQKRS